MLALSVACTAAAVVWAYLLIGHGGYWRTDQRLPRMPGSPSRACLGPVPVPGRSPSPGPVPGRGRAGPVAGRDGGHPGPQ